jgi:hypothetical protein
MTKLDVNNLNTTEFINGDQDFISKDSDILTENGWVNIEGVYNSNFKIANFDIKTKEIRFDIPIKKIKSFKNECLVIDGKNTKQKVSLDHNIILNGDKIKSENLIDRIIQEKEFILRGKFISSGLPISDDTIRLLTWIICDGTIVDYSKYGANSKKCTIQFKLSKERKIERLSLLLNENNIKYTLRKAKMYGINKKQPYYICIYSDAARKLYHLLNGIKEIPNSWKDISTHQVKIFLEELQNTDGRKVSNTEEIRWSTVNKHDTDVVQEMCLKNNIYLKYKALVNASGFKNGKIQHECSIYLEKSLNTHVNIFKQIYNDYMYCFQMPLGTIITRLDGKIAFTGSCL